MVKYFSELLECLNQFKSVASSLLSVARQHSGALIKLKPDDLKLLVSKEEILVVKMADLKKECSIKRDMCISYLGMPQDAVLSDVISYAPSDLRSGLFEIFLEVKEILMELNEVNEINKLLTLNSIELNIQLVKIFFPSGDLTYKGDGAINNKQPKISRLNLTV